MKKVILIAAAVVLVGIALSVVALALGGGTQGTVYQPVTHKVETPFSAIRIEAFAADVILEASPSDACYAVCSENEDIVYRVTVENEVLQITEEDTRRWYEYFEISFGDGPRQAVILYLPEGAYAALSVKTASGDIICTRTTLSFDAVSLEAASGDLDFASSVKVSLRANIASGDIEITGSNAGEILLESASGDIELEGALAGALLSVKTASGNIELTGIQAKKISLTSSSGEITLQDVQAEARLEAETASGEIALLRCDAGELLLKSASGDVTATLLNPKIFSVQSFSGDVRYPASVKDGGSCTVSTASGNIEIRIVE